MKLSSDLYVLSSRLGDEQAVRMMADAGFDAIDYSLYWRAKDRGPYGSDYKAYARHLRALAEDRGVYFNQAHAPFDSYRFDDPANNAERFSQIVQAMEFASLLGVKTIIVHPIHCPPEVDRVDFNVDFYNRLKPWCREFGIRVALENLFDRVDGEKIVPSICSFPDEFRCCVDLLDPEYFTACVDVGHALVVGETPEHVLREMGERVTALHIHDNRGILDDHMLPGFGKIDWKGTMRALREIGYPGELTLEIFAWLQCFDNEMLGDAARLAVKTGRKLIAEFERV